MKIPWRRNPQGESVARTIGNFPLRLIRHLIQLRGQHTQYTGDLNTVARVFQVSPNAYLHSWNAHKDRPHASVPLTTANLKRIAARAGLDGRLPSVHRLEPLNNEHTKLAVLFDDNLAVAAQTSSCSITGIYLPTTSGGVHPALQSERKYVRADGQQPTTTSGCLEKCADLDKCFATKYSGGSCMLFSDGDTPGADVDYVVFRQASVVESKKVYVTYSAKDEQDTSSVVTTVSATTAEQCAAYLSRGVDIPSSLAENVVSDGKKKKKKKKKQNRVATTTTAAPAPVTRTVHGATWKNNKCELYYYAKWLVVTMHYDATGCTDTTCIHWEIYRSSDESVMTSYFDNPADLPTGPTPTTLFARVFDGQIGIRGVVVGGVGAAFAVGTVIWHFIRRKDSEACTKQ